MHEVSPLIGNLLVDPLQFAHSLSPAVRVHFQESCCEMAAHSQFFFDIGSDRRCRVHDHT